jgi:hypothetical protein
VVQLGLVLSVLSGDITYLQVEFLVFGFCILFSIPKREHVILDTGSVSLLTYDSRKALNWVPQKDLFSGTWPPVQCTKCRMQVILRVTCRCLRINILDASSVLRLCCVEGRTNRTYLICDTPY